MAKYTLAKLVEGTKEDVVQLSAEQLSNIHGGDPANMPIGTAVGMIGGGFNGVTGLGVISGLTGAIGNGTALGIAAAIAQ